MRNLFEYIKEQFSFLNRKEGEWKIGYITLFVADIQSMKKFYTKILGMDVLQDFNGIVLLGNSMTSTCLLKLVQHVPLESTNIPAARMQYFGLQFARRQDLGNLANHLLMNETAINATEDDGYSEALYIEDPEKNKIKVFWEKTTFEHVERDVNQREGSQLQLPINHFLTLGDKHYERIPGQTQTSQLHLVVTSIEESERFYTSLFAFTSTFDYLLHRKNLTLNSLHYALAINTWDGIVTTHNEAAFGLHLITFFAPSIKAIEKLANRLQEQNIEYTYDNGDLYFLDPNRFKIQVTLGE